MNTFENLQEAFGGECQAIRKYLIFAKKAEAEGFHGAAMLFRAMAVSETAHANSQLKIMDEIKSTRENFATAIKVEEQESKGLYPEFIAAAQKENNQQAVDCFKNALVGEQVHFSLLIETLKKIEAGENPLFEKIAVCGNCGNITLNKPKSSCDICGEAEDKIIQVN